MQGLAQRPLGLGALVVFVLRVLQRRHRLVHRLVIDIEFPSENLQESLATLGVEREVNSSQISGPGAGGHFAAARLQAIAHLVLQRLHILFWQIGARCRE